jgi:hypothetical protein
MGGGTVRVGNGRILMYYIHLVRNLIGPREERLHHINNTEPKKQGTKCDSPIVNGCV